MFDSDEKVSDKESANPSEREQLIANALAEYVDQESRGVTVALDEFCGTHPDLEPELRHQIQALDQIDTVLQFDTQLAHSEHDAAQETEKDTPQRLSGNKILGEIGSGGMGRVFLGLDERLGRKVAIKTLRSIYAENSALRSRFMQEARAMARLSHRHIVRIYNLGSDDEAPHFVMEYLEGTSLTSAAERLTLRQKAELIQKVVAAVDFLHQHQVIHRDLKPGNIVVGPDLEPKVLDFGLALHTDDQAERLTLAGEIVGTPNYFSPEQARGAGPLDARSDIFSLGAILYQLLTGSTPFRGETVREQIELICEEDPVLPRRIDPGIPGDLQNVCMKALEKRPEDRYGSAREMSDDLGRYLSGEPVLALPSSYSRMMSGKIEQHLRELRGWKQDEILSEHEFDGFKKVYDRLVEPEDAWIMEVRRLSVAQVSLYLGAWLLVTGAALIVLFQYLGLSGAMAVLVVAAGAAPTGYLGIRSWKRGNSRVAIAYLLAFCLLLPITFAVAMSTVGVAGSLTQGREDLELMWKFASFKKTTNAQLWWSLLLSLPAFYWLRRFTGAAVFSLALAVGIALLSLVTLLRMGLLEWLEQDPGKVYFHLIPIAVLFFAGGLVIERLGHASDSRYFYPLAVVFTLIALSGVAAFHDPYAAWLKSIAPVTRGQVEYLFIINAGVYLVMQYLCERVSTAQMRSVAKSLRFVIPGHVMTSMLLLGIAASALWEESPDDGALRLEARVFEVLLPVVACVFVFGSIPKQMKNFFASGLLFLAIGIVRIQQDLLKDNALWPVTLLLLGFLLMLGAANYSAIRIALTGLVSRKPRG
jgi:predicted Ser/Thr protein kinase